MIPITDKELYDRADVIVHGVVTSNAVEEDADGKPVTVSVIAPREVLKGQLAGDLVLRQLGGELPDGRFLKIWGRPEYQPGHEVVVFAIARPDGDYQTAELLLGKFEVKTDESGTAFAVPALTAAPPGVTVVRGQSSDVDDAQRRVGEMTSPRELAAFLGFLRQPDALQPVTPLEPGVEPSTVVGSDDVVVQWAPLGGLWRWNNGATAAWTLQGTANVTGGGVTEAANAVRTWDDEADSAINFSLGSGSADLIHLNALSAPCGWNSCISSSGVIGCATVGGGGAHTWRGETYSTITRGEVWLRSYCSLNAFDAISTQAVLTHELGHTLGLGHSNQDSSPHDVCRGDEGLAQMRSFVQHRVTLGTDDSDAVRWLYGDGGRSCLVLTVTKAGSGAGTVTSTPAGISCGTTCSAIFGSDDAVTLTAVPGTKSVFTGWSGDPDCADGAVIMDASKSCTATFALLPDLVVTALSVPDAAVPGTAISVAETTRNNAGPADVSTTRYYLSRNATWDAADPEIGARPVPPLGAGATSPTTLSLTIPVDTPTGNYYVIARADADGQRAESNETNNTRAASIRISPPDLVVSALSVPTSGGAGQTIRVTNTTRNQSGAGPAPASMTRFYLSLVATLAGSPVEIGSRSVGALQPGHSSAVASNVTIPAGAPPGTWYIIAKADADDAISEVSETNNTRSDTIVIGPDLVVSSLSVSATGQLITVTDTVKNQGGGSTLVPTTVDFYLSTNSTLGVGDVPLGSRTVDILGPTATSRVTTTLTIPAGTVAGSYYVIARVNAGATVAEVTESNNTRAASIRLSPAP